MVQEPASSTADPARIRNIGVVAHINAGKTTLSERILFDTGAQRFMGEVDDGTAAMDFLAEEQRRGISISAALTRVDWKGYRIHLIDTPGHVDFTAEVERCLRVLDAVIVVLDGIRGVESQTETVWRQATQRGIPRLVFVNKLDRLGASMARVVEHAAERLDARLVPVGWPLGEGADFRGIVDLVRRAVQRFDEREVEQPPEWPRLQAELLEACADHDPSVMADYVEDRPIAPERLLAALRTGTLAGSLVPVLPGAALHNRGVDLLLDAAALFLPSPVDLPPVVGVGAETRAPSRSEPLSALVFKRFRDGDEVLAGVRIYSGEIRPGLEVGLRGAGRQAVTRVREVAVVRATEREVVPSAGPGEVVALVVEESSGLRNGETVHDVGAPIVLEAVEFPEPVLRARLEPRGPGDLMALTEAAEFLVEEDPTLRLTRMGDGDALELLVEGMGELHLEVFGSRLRRRVGDRVRIGRPSVQRRVALRGGGEGSAECRAPSDPSIWAKVAVRLEPLADGVEVVAAWAEHSLADALVDELRQQVDHGLGHSWPPQGVRAELESIESAGSDEGLVRVVASEALGVAVRKAAQAAGAVLLEPFVDLVVTCPRESKSSVLADLRSREADVRQVEEDLERARVEGRLPLAETLGYPTELRSMTRGLGDVQLRPAGYGARSVGNHGG